MALLMDACARAFYASRLTMTTIPFDDIRAWLFEAALPLWAEKGVDPAGGFYEALDFEGRPVEPGFRRTRVVARQTYVFAHAGRLGWAPGVEISEKGAAHLDALYLGPDRGWPRTNKDDTPDLYDLAFTLFAYAWRHRIAPDEGSMQGMHRVLDFLEAHMCPDEGFHPALPPGDRQLQNPHMHLLEACLAAFEASGDERFSDTANDLMFLFGERLFKRGVLTEYFTPDWKRAPGEEGRIVEPGHHFEWAWLIKECGRLIEYDAAAPAKALIDFAERHGVSPSGAVRQSVRDDGAILDGSSRIWSNTERIKAHLALFELTGADARAPVAASANLLLDRCLSTDVPGLWIDHFDAEGKPLSKNVPASSFYHIFLAFAELLRLEPRLRALG
ncbi:MAG: AGE family epimerase/isomerase [Hyphomonadaceae bacterium]